MPAFSTFSHVFLKWKTGGDAFWDHPSRPADIKLQPGEDGTVTQHEIDEWVFASRQVVLSLWTNCRVMQIPGEHP